MKCPCSTLCIICHVWVFMVFPLVLSMWETLFCGFVFKGSQELPWVSAFLGWPEPSKHSTKSAWSNLCWASQLSLPGARAAGPWADIQPVPALVPALSIMLCLGGLLCPGACPEAVWWAHLCSVPTLCKWLLEPFLTSSRTASIDGQLSSSSCDPLISQQSVLKSGPPTKSAFICTVTMQQRLGSSAWS